MKFNYEELKIILGALNAHWEDCDKRNDYISCEVIDSLAIKVKEEINSQSGLMKR